MHGQDKLFVTKEVKKSTNPVSMSQQSNTGNYLLIVPLFQCWAETHTVHIDNPFRPIHFQVYDKDMVGSDDFMGEAEVDLQEMDLKKWVLPNLFAFLIDALMFSFWCCTTIYSQSGIRSF